MHNISSYEVSQIPETQQLCTNNIHFSVPELHEKTPDKIL